MGIGPVTSATAALGWFLLAFCLGAGWALGVWLVNRIVGKL